LGKGIYHTIGQLLENLIKYVDKVELVVKNLQIANFMFAFCNWSIFCQKYRYGN